MHCQCTVTPITGHFLNDEKQPPSAAGEGEVANYCKCIFSFVCKTSLNNARRKLNFHFSNGLYHCFARKRDRERERQVIYSQYKLFQDLTNDSLTRHLVIFLMLIIELLKWQIGLKI